MGKTGENSWFNAVKRAFRSPVKDNETRNSRRGEEHEQEDEEKVFILVLNSHTMTLSVR